MALIANKINPRAALNCFRVLSSPLVKQCHWFPYYKPDAYPKTAEERIAAAKKYNLLPEEYKPIKSTTDPAGDYPDLPYENVDTRDPYYDWDYPELRRDYQEPVNKYMVFLFPEQVSTKQPDATTTEIFSIFFGVIGLISLLCYYFDRFKLCHPVLERQKGGPDITHYTFELDYLTAYSMQFIRL